MCYYPKQQWWGQTRTHHSTHACAPTSLSRPLTSSEKWHTLLPADAHIFTTLAYWPFPKHHNKSKTESGRRPLLWCCLLNITNKCTSLLSGSAFFFCLWKIIHVMKRKREKSMNIGWYFSVWRHARKKATQKCFCYVLLNTFPDISNAVFRKFDIEKESNRLISHSNLH